MRVGFAGTPAFAARGAGGDPRGRLRGPAGADAARPAARPRAEARGLRRSRRCALAHGLAGAAAGRRSRPTRRARRRCAIPLDVLVVAAYGLILPPAVLAWPRHGCLNIHASLLPRWRGAAPIQRALLAGDARDRHHDHADGRRARHRADARRRPRADRRRARPAASLHDRLAAAGADAIVAVARAAGARRRARRQRRSRPRARPTRPRSPRRRGDRLGRTTRRRIDRQVRAFDPAPGRVDDARRRAGEDLAGAAARPRRAGRRRPGTVLAADADGHRRRLRRRACCASPSCSRRAAGGWTPPPSSPAGALAAGMRFGAADAWPAARRVEQSGDGPATEPSMQEAQRLAALAVRRVLEGSALPVALAAVAPPGDDGAAGAGARWCRSSPTARCATGARSTRWSRRSRRSRSPIRCSRALVAVALYQLDHTRAPPFAVVDHAVDAAATLARPAAKALVNALLRRYLREREALRRGGPRRPGGALVVSALVDRARRGRLPGRLAGDPRRRQRAAAADAAGQPRGSTRATRCSRASPRRASPRRPSASARHHRRPAAAGAGAARLRRGRVLGAGPRRAARRAAARRPRPGMRVLDACAAPGGKTDAPRSSSPTSSSSRSTATRRGSPRVRENLARLRLAGARVHGASPATPARPRDWWDGRPFDRILADVPCTASGVVRRHPDGKWLRRETRRRALRAQQARIARRALAAARARRAAAVRDLLGVRAPKTRRRSTAFVAPAPRRVARNHHLCRRRSPHAAGNSCLRSPGAGHNQDGFFYALLRKALTGAPAGGPRRAAPRPTPRHAVPPHAVAPVAVLAGMPLNPRLPPPVGRRRALRAPRGARWRAASRSLLALAAAAGARRHDRASSRPSCASTRTAYVLNAEFELALNADARGGAAEGHAAVLRARVRAHAPALVLARREGASTSTVSIACRYNALTRQYRVSSGLLAQTFDSLEEVERFLSRVTSRPVARRDQLAKGARYEAARAPAPRRQPAAEAVPGQRARVARVDAAVRLASLELHAMTRPVPVARGLRWLLLDLRLPGGDRAVPARDGDREHRAVRAAATTCCCCSTARWSRC